MAAGSSSKGLQTVYMTAEGGGKSTLMFVMPQDQKLFQCGLCSVVFDFNRDLLVHVKAHLSTKPFQCGYCKVSYESNFELTVHVKTHQLPLHVQQEKVSTLQNVMDDVQSRQRHCGVRKVDKRSTVTKLSSEKERLTVLPEEGDDFSSDSEALRQDHTINLGLEMEGGKKASSEASLTESTVCEITRLESSRKDPENQKIMTPTEIQSLDRDVQKLMGQIQGDTTVSGSEEPPEPSAVSVNSDESSSLEMTAEDVQGKQSRSNPIESTLDQKAPAENSFSCVTDQGGRAEATFPDAGQSAHWPLKRKEDTSVNIHQKGQRLQHTAGSGDGAFRPFVCSLCGIHFEDAKFVGQHFRSVHKKGKDQIVFCCPTDHSHGDTDRETINYSDEIVTYWQTTSVSKLYECYVCEQQFKYRNDLSCHILTVHGENDLRVFECGLCGLRFKLAHHARDHFDARHGSLQSRAQQHYVGCQKFGPAPLPPHLRTSSGISLSGPDTLLSVYKPSDNSLTGSASESVDMAEGDADYGDAFCDDGDNSDRPGNTVSVPSCRNGARRKQLSGSRKRSSNKLEITATARSTDSSHIIIVKAEPDSHESLEGKASESNTEDEQQMFSSSEEVTSDQRTPEQNTSYCVSDQIASAKSNRGTVQSKFSAEEKREDKSESSPKTVEHLYHTTAEKDKVSGPFVCALCGKSFQEANHVNVHIQRVHKKRKEQAKRRLPCDAGHASADKDPTAADSGGDKPGQAARTSDLATSFQCEVCERVFRYRHHLRRHASLIHNESELRLFVCGVCGHKFKLAHHLKSHFDALHGSSQPRLHQCHICGRKYTLLHHLKQHTKSCFSIRGFQSMSSHLKEMVLEGPEGSLTSQEKSGRGMIPKRPLKKPGEKKATMCHVCGKIALGSTALKSHMLALHTDARPFQCQLCPKSFRFKNSLHEHTKTHTKEKPFVCDICGKSFATKCTFKCHRHTHTNEKPYQCDICQKGFNSYSGLGSHRLRHKEDKRYACDKCGKKFYTSGLMKRHAVTHTDLRPLSCKKCGKTYRSSGSLTYHMTHVHPT